MSHLLNVGSIYCSPHKEYKFILKSFFICLDLTIVNQTVVSKPEKLTVISTKPRSVADWIFANKLGIIKSFITVKHIYLLHRLKIEMNLQVRKSKLAREEIIEEQSEDGDKEQNKVKKNLIKVKKERII